MPRFRAGFALPLVLALLALGGVLVTASFLLGRLESQSAENGLRTAQAFEAAETGLASTLANWDPALDTLSLGGFVSMQSAAVATASWHSRIQRLSEDLFQVRAEGAVPIPGVAWQAKRQLGVILRWAAALPQPAAVTVTDSMIWAGFGSASGYSVTYPGWPSCTPDSVPAVMVDSLSGSVSTAIAPLVYGVLAARASRTPNGSIAGVGPTLTGQPAVCDWADSLNWGEPMRGGPPSPCTSLLPVIHASGDLTLNGGRGQGVLLIDGDLVLGGGFDFFGLVVVQGQFAIGAGGAHITGGVIARSLTVPPAYRLDVDYSACVLRKVLRGPSQAIPLQYRSWAQLY